MSASNSVLQSFFFKLAFEVMHLPYVALCNKKTHKTIVETAAVQQLCAYAQHNLAFGFIGIVTSTTSVFVSYWS